MIINDYEDLGELEFDEVAETWDSSDFRSRYEHLRDKKDLDTLTDYVV